MMKEQLQKLIESGDIFDLTKVNSFLHQAYSLSPELIVPLYEEYKHKWIKAGTFTYYAEDFLKYQDSPKLNDTFEVFSLWIIAQELLKHNEQEKTTRAD